MDGEHLPRDQEAKFTEFDDETLRLFSKSILDFLATNDVGGDDKATPLTSKPSPASTVATAPFSAQPSSTPAFLGAPNSKRPRVRPSKPPKARVFAPPKTKNEVEQARTGAIPKKTCDDMMYCLRIWNEWRHHRQVNYGDSIPEICQIDTAPLAHHLSSFILEVRKKNGDEFPPNSLFHIVSGIQRYLRYNGKPSVDFFNDPVFAGFKLNLDAEMKRLQKKGLGSKKRQAEPLSLEEEELLWEKGLIGSTNPQALVDTMLFMNGLYFALRSGEEHRQLRFDPCQIELVEQPGQRSYLKYTEDISKNRPGGLKGRKTKPKVVIHHANEENPERCFVQLFKMYNSLCPHDRPKDAFYLQPLKNMKPNCWYSSKPIGHNTLEGTVARLCKKAGISGLRTNHSLRATTATRLYQAGVDEQLVMERTGHQSLEGVRSYKHTSEAQQANLSDILNGASTSSMATSLQLQNNSSNAPDNLSQKSKSVCLSATTTSTNSLAIQPVSFNFQSCSVTINYMQPQ